MTILWAIVLFGVLIFFHELGHFIFAKLSGVGVLKFSLGFGPALLRKKIGETEYMLSAIPLGGYVKMIGEEPGEEISEEDKARAFNLQPVIKRMGIVLAGPVFNFVLAYIIFVGFLSINLPIIIPDFDTVTNTTIEVIEDDSSAERAGLKVNDKVVSINDKAVSTWVEMEQVFFESPGREIRLTVQRGEDLIDFKVIPEAITIKGPDDSEIVFGKVGISKRTATVGSVMKNSPASKAGLKREDKIISINTVSVNDWGEMAEIISKNPEKEITLKVQRGSDVFDVTIVPEPEKIKDGEGKEVIVGKIGITRDDVIVSKGILGAPVKGIEAVYEWSVLMLEVIWSMLTGTVSAKQVGGPILIVDAAAKAASAGVFTYFNFIAIISINLAILNLLPVPVLDGGHLMFMSIEALRGRPLSTTAIGVATKIGMALLLLLITLVSYNDIMRIVVPWFQKTFN